jgi:hypothetical protein
MVKTTLPYRMLPLPQTVPRNRIKGIKRKKSSSLMLSADQLGFTAQQLADLAAYLEKH